MATFAISNRERGGMGALEPSKIHWEALTHETQQVFHKVAVLPFIDRFYLAGGSGLALHLGHRFSIDLIVYRLYGLTEEEVAIVEKALTLLRSEAVHPSPNSERG